MENDLISRSALIKWFSPYMHEDEAIPPDVVIGDIKSAPAVDAVPVKYGRQEKSKEDDEWYGKYFTCLGCHTRTMAVDPHFNEIEPTYCPNCGAKWIWRQTYA